jgi:Tfp pilus assembly protein PilW
MAMNNKPCLLLQTKPGFSLVEAIVALGLSGLILGLLVSLMIESNRVQIFLSDQSTAIGTADATLSLLSQELRETTDGDDGAYALAEAGNTSFAFYSDIDADSAAEYIRYALVGTELQKTSTEPTGSPAQYLAENAVTTTVAFSIVNDSFTGNPIFSYYDTSNVELTEPISVSDVTLIKVHLDVNVDPNQIPDTHTSETVIQLRNLNDNL